MGSPPVAFTPENSVPLSIRDPGTPGARDRRPDTGNNMTTTDFPKIDLATTVCAIATPVGRGGLGIVRLSGPDAIAIADRVFRPSRKSGELSRQEGFTVHHGFCVDTTSGETIDEVLATVFRSPKSFTGEELVEFSAHGGQVVLRRILHIMTECGANMAAPGEFTLRAFLNGRIDLTEAEAVGDVGHSSFAERPIDLAAVPVPKLACSVTVTLPEPSGRLPVPHPMPAQQMVTIRAAPATPQPKKNKANSSNMSP